MNYLKHELCSFQFHHQKKRIHFGWPSRSLCANSPLISVFNLGNYMLWTDYGGFSSFSRVIALVIPKVLCLLLRFVNSLWIHKLKTWSTTFSGNATEQTTIFLSSASTSQWSPFIVSFPSRATDTLKVTYNLREYQVWGCAHSTLYGLLNLEGRRWPNHNLWIMAFSRIALEDPFANIFPKWVFNWPLCLRMSLLFPLSVSFNLHSVWSCGLSFCTEIWKIWGWSNRRDRIRIELKLVSDQLLVLLRHKQMSCFCNTFCPDFCLVFLHLWSELDAVFSLCAGVN